MFEPILEKLLVSDEHSSVVFMTSDSTESWLKGSLKRESTSAPHLYLKLHLEK